MSGGRPVFEPDDKQRLAVATLSACGARHEVIARHFGIDRKTLRKHFRLELAEGRTDANAAVARSLFSQAIAGNVTAQIFWLKTRAGWRETATVEVSGPNGRPLIPAPLLSISWADGGPGLPMVERPNMTLDDAPLEESAENEPDYGSIEACPRHSQGGSVSG
jgi:hypothetical protein